MKTPVKLGVALTACLAVTQLDCSISDPIDSGEEDLLRTSNDVCTTVWGDVQDTAAASAHDELATAGVVGHYTVTKTQIDTRSMKVGLKSYDGKVYQFKASIDLGTILTNGIAAKVKSGELHDANLYVACDYTKAATSSLGYASEKSAMLDDAMAKELCQTIKTEADENAEDAVKHAAVSSQGFTPSSVAVSSTTSSTLSFKTTLKTSGSYTTKGGEKQGWTFVKEKCKSWFSSPPSYTYPALGADGTGTPTGTPEMSSCIDPDTLGAYDPGIFWVDASSAYMGEIKIVQPDGTTARLGHDFSLSTAEKVIAMGEDDQTVYVEVPTITAVPPPETVSYKLPTTGQTIALSTRSMFVSVTRNCGWDAEATDWWVDPADNCSALSSALQSSISETVYDGLFAEDPKTGVRAVDTMAASLMDLIGGIIVDSRGAALQADKHSDLAIKSVSVDVAAKRLVVVWEAVGC